MSAKFSGIGELKEKSLHAALKRWYALPTDGVEVKVEGFIIDLVRENTLVEIQTRNFAKIRRKIERLVENYKLHLIFPIPRKKWIVTTDICGNVVRRSRSPKTGCYHHLFTELVSIPKMILSSNFSVEVLLVDVEESRCMDGKGSWRRQGISVIDSTLINVYSSKVFRKAEDFLSLLPQQIDQPFSNRMLSKHKGWRMSLAAKTTYSLTRMGVLEVVAKDRRAHLFARV